jgi:3-deoxy-D-manno-octulosonic-acid transferase
VALYLLFYRLFLLLYGAGVRVAALQNKKARLWLKGRENWQPQLQQHIREKFTPDQPTIWMHCASLGEFEQGRPVLEKLKEQHAGANVLVSFFSPSGYEVRKNYAGANVVCYLPMDSPATAQAFLQLVKPDLVLWVKYEYWYFYLTWLRNLGIPLLLVSGIFRPGQPFFRWYGGMHRRMLGCFTALFVQNEASAQLTAGIAGGSRVKVTGDTRFDRVVAIAEAAEAIPKVEQWLAGTQQVMVCGSTWDEDEKELNHYIKLHPEIKFIIAPHNVNETEIMELQQLIPHAVLYTTLSQQAADASSHVLVVNTVGLLARLYQYATVAFVGGGFGSGIHNVLEAAVWGKPVVHGPEYEKFAEAKDLIRLGGAFEVADALHLEQQLNLLFTDAMLYNKAATTAKQYVYDHQGATASIVAYIQANRLLTK